MPFEQLAISGAMANAKYQMENGKWKAITP
jgi:hypothetical protein